MYLTKVMCVCVFDGKNREHPCVIDRVYWWIYIYIYVENERTYVNCFEGMWAFRCLGFCMLYKIKANKDSIKLDLYIYI